MNKIQNNLSCPNCQKLHNNEGLLAIHLKYCNRKTKIENTILKPSEKFLHNKYTNWYYKIVNFSRKRVNLGYIERHHIIPKSIGGLDINENMVSLTAREHFLCHYLLTKMVHENTNEFIKLIHAFTYMKSGHRENRYFNSILYSRAKENLSKIMKEKSTGENNIWYGHCWIFNKELKKNLRISKNELEYYISKNDGWQKGRCMDFDKKPKEKNIKPIIIKEKKIKENIVKTKYVRKKIIRDSIYVPYRKTGSIKYTKHILKIERDITWDDYNKVRDLIIHDLKTLSYTQVSIKYDMNLSFPNKMLVNAFSLKNYP